MRFRCINVIRVRGSVEKILSEERITSDLDFVPLPDGSAILMFPVHHLVERNTKERQHGIMETPPMSKMDIRDRGVITLTKAEAVKAITAKPGQKLVFVRHGWGQVWNQIVQKETI